MSAISARKIMTHRLYTERDQNLGVEVDGGYDAAPDWQPHLTDEPCYLYSDFRSGFSGEFAIAERGEVTRTLYRMLVSQEADILNTDRITQVERKNGTLIYQGILGIDVIRDRTNGYTVLFLSERR